MNFPVFMSVILLGVSIMPQAIFGLNKTKDMDWDYLKLARTWPPAFCIELYKEQRCDLPKNLTGWVIHGLWPTKNGTEGPDDCIPSWKFDVEKVQALRPKLDVNWPALIYDETVTETWSHEWKKHGTCGTSLPALKDQLKYFNVTLSKHLAINLSNLLSKGGIEPSKTVAYKREHVLKILMQGLGVSPILYCVERREFQCKRRVHLVEVEVCFSKAFKLMDCPALAAPNLTAARTPPASSPAQQLFKPYPCSSEFVFYKPFP